jgi:DNA polymerase III epsilon subunit-like protein
MKKNSPKVLFIDIETCPIEAHVWSLWENNVSLNQIMKDWSVLSWAAKWQGQAKVMYADVRSQKNKRDDSKVIKGIWELMDEADIIVGQNSKSFDVKKLNARFIINGMKPPSSYRQLDTKVMAKKVFGFTSNRLEYMADKLCTKYKKLKHKNFAGHEMWVECLKGNPKAWQEMEKYNKHDVLALEELYNKLIAWDNTINFNVYHKNHSAICTCGSENIRKNGKQYTNGGSYDRFKCSDCGKNFQDKYNLLSPKKRREMLK